MNLHKSEKKKCLWPWQIIVMILPMIWSYLIVGATGNLADRWLILSGGATYLVFVLFFDQGRLPRDRMNDRKLIPPLLFIGIELTVNWIYAYVNHIPFFRYPISVILRNALAIGWFEELVTSLIWVSMLTSLVYCRKQQVTKQNLSAVVFVASTLFGLIHLTNLPTFLKAGKNDPLFLVILLVLLQIVSAFALGLVTKSIFLKTGSLFYCILIHFLLNISRMGTVMPNALPVYDVVIAGVYLLYGVHESKHIEETVVNEWNRRLDLSEKN